MKKVELRDLKPDQKCKVRVRHPETGEDLGLHDAIYQSENAVIMGWDFEIPGVDVEGNLEVGDVFTVQTDRTR